MSLTQYLESQKDQDMIRLLNFTKTQKMGGIYNSGGGNMNGMPFNEG